MNKFLRAFAFSAAIACFAAAATAAVTPLFNFSFAHTQGRGNVSSLVADPQGRLYGTTYYGGEYGYGTIFRLSPPANGQTVWQHEVLYSFCQLSSCLDGYYPTSGVIIVTQPNGVTALFGTTQAGGGSENGTVFRLQQMPSGAWAQTVIHDFEGGNDGADPLGGLIVDAHGVLYGTTNGGGTGNCTDGCGTVFKVEPPNSAHPDWWEESVLHSFNGGSEGSYPKSGVSFGSQGVLYGTTQEGGTSGYGTAFKLVPPGGGQTQWTHSVLWSFAGGAQGGYPRAALLVDAFDGLYGTTTYGGANCSMTEGCGTVFKLVPPDKYINAWTLSMLHSFNYLSQTNGQYPLGALIFGEDGAIYGTTQYGGTPVGTAPAGPCGFIYNCGTIFRLTGAHSDWAFSIAHKFCTADTGCPVGAYPTAGLTVHGGALYGTTSYDSDGVACDCGGIFRLDYPDRPRRGRRP